MRKADALRKAVCEILWRDWDPIGIKLMRAAHGLNRVELDEEYDSYARHICELLSNGADEFKLTEHLAQLRHSLSLKEDIEADRLVARMLRDLT